ALAAHHRQPGKMNRPLLPRRDRAPWGDSHGWNAEKPRPQSVRANRTPPTIRSRLPQSWTPPPSARSPVLLSARPTTGPIKRPPWARTYPKYGGAELRARLAPRQLPPSQQKTSRRRNRKPKLDRRAGAF